MNLEGGAQRKVSRLARAACPRGWGGGRAGGAATALNLRGASPSRAGEAQVPGRAALTCARSRGRGEIPAWAGRRRRARPERPAVAVSPRPAAPRPRPAQGSSRRPQEFSRFLQRLTKIVGQKKQKNMYIFSTTIPTGDAPPSSTVVAFTTSIPPLSPLGPLKSWPGTGNRALEGPPFLTRQMGDLPQPHGAQGWEGEKGQRLKRAEDARGFGDVSIRMTGGVGSKETEGRAPG